MTTRWIINSVPYGPRIEASPPQRRLRPLRLKSHAELFFEQLSLIAVLEAAALALGGAALWLAVQL